MEMTETDVVDVLRLCRQAGVEIWLDGGWAVDAVLSEQTRPHDDLDILVDGSHVEALRRALESCGFRERPDGRAANFVLADAAERRVDVHVITLQPGGDGIYDMEDGSIWVFTAASLAGRGTVGGVDVRCLSPEEQVRCHDQGYEPRDKDFADMAMLETRLGVALRPDCEHEPPIDDAYRRAKEIVMPKLTIVAHVTAKPDQVALVEAELEKLVAPTRVEAGCLQYDLHRDNENPEHFMFYESWESRELWQAHMNAAHLQAYRTATEGAIESFTLYEMTQTA